MRKFWLENNEGKLWNLTPRNPYDQKSSVFADPSGLGIKTKVTSYDVENVSFIEKVDTQSQTISGDVSLPLSRLSLSIISSSTTS